MSIEKIKEKSVWENFLLACKEKTFLSSWNWGEFQKSMGNKIWRLGVFEYLRPDLKYLLAAALVVKIEAKRGTFLFVPHAPSVALAKEGGPDIKSEVLKILLEELKKITKEEKCDFIRIAPVWQRNPENIKVFKGLGFREAPIHMHPELTWELDITPSENELLAKMRKTTRYLIKQAQKNRDIQIIKSNALEDIEKFNELYQTTVDRHHFAPFSLSYLKNEFLAFAPAHEILLFLGKYRGEIVSGGIFVFWQGIGFYHHGASSLKYPKIPVSYLLQWEAIKEAKNRGCKKFNFWGIAPFSADAENGNQKSKIIVSKTKVFEKLENQKFAIKKHPWYGLTLFKMGFGGYKKDYVKTQDLPFSKRYWLNWVIEKLRKAKRGL